MSFRYSTQTTVIGELNKQKIALIGLGGLGCLVGSYLAGAGVNMLIYDGDVITESNLHRQVIYKSSQIGELKAQVARVFFRELNPVNISAVSHKLCLENCDMLKDVSLVIDCSDNFSTHYLVSDVCSWFDKPYIIASCEGWRGFAGLFNYSKEAPTYRALFPESEFRCGGCAQNGIIGPTVGIVASIQAQMALKFLAGIVTKKLAFLNEEGVRYLDFKGQIVQEVADQDYYDMISGRYLSKKGITWQEYRARCDELVLVDVREFEEVAVSVGDFVVPSSILSRVDRCETLSKLRFNKGTTYALFCKSGLRSERACKILDKFGYSTTYLIGGMEAFI